MEVSSRPAAVAVALSVPLTRVLLFALYGVCVWSDASLVLPVLSRWVCWSLITERQRKARTRPDETDIIIRLKRMAPGAVVADSADGTPDDAGAPAPAPAPAPALPVTPYSIVYIFSAASKKEIVKKGARSKPRNVPHWMQCHLAEAPSDEEEEEGSDGDGDGDDGGDDDGSVGGGGSDVDKGSEDRGGAARAGAGAGAGSSGRGAPARTKRVRYADGGEEEDGDDDDDGDGGGDVEDDGEYSG